MLSCLNSATETVEVTVCGQVCRVPSGISAAAAYLLTQEQWGVRQTPVTGENRAPLCMMGVCFECLMEINGEANQQGCLVTVEEGMRIAPQQGARAL